MPSLKLITESDLSRWVVQRSKAPCFDNVTIATVTRIVEDIEESGEAAIRRYAAKFDGLVADTELVIDRTILAAAFEALPAKDKQVLERVANRIRTFAKLQRSSLGDCSLKVDGGEIGSQFIPFARAGCYAPGGRYPLPSSVLMTTITAQEAGVSEIWVASPKPTAETLAAAYLGGAQGVLQVGGAQAIAALAFGVGPIQPCEIIVGPGNRWVTTAKALLKDRVAIDMIAGPSELLVLADATAPADLVAADLLAQAEHDPDSIPMLVVDSEETYRGIEFELESQLTKLATNAVASQSLERGFYLVADSVGKFATFANQIAAEHLEVMHSETDELVPLLREYGALFIGPNSAEVLGDYGIGPNHVLPTGGFPRRSSGLSVATFLRQRSWVRIEDSALAEKTLKDSIAMAEIEGLPGHAEAARKRL